MHFSNGRDVCNPAGKQIKMLYKKQMAKKDFGTKARMGLKSYIKNCLLPTLRELK